MKLTKRQEIQLNKVFDNPKKLRKWVDDVYNDIINQAEKKTKQMINEYLDIYSVAVAYTLRYVCGLGKKRLPEVMSRIWNNVDALKEEYISYEDCIKDLKDNGIEFENIVNEDNKIKWKEQ